MGLILVSGTSGFIGGLLASRLGDKHIPFDPRQNLDFSFLPKDETSTIVHLGSPSNRVPEAETEIIDAARPAHNSPPPLCYSSVWLSMNVLVLDPKTVCVEASETNQMEQLDKLGFEVVPVPFRDAYAFGGGLHCATADVFREGKCENYFNFS